MIQPMPRSHRVAGALIGSAVGDALGAPFEFGPAGRFSARLPSPTRGAATEMCGGGSLGWQPGEFTDDTQMALLVAASLVERDGLDEADLFERFRTWLRALMRTTPTAIWFARFGQSATVDAARRISALTHGDPSVGEGCAVFHELVRVALDGGDPLAAIPAALDLVAPEHRDRWAAVLAVDWTPEQATESNGAVWPTLGRRSGRSGTDATSPR
jgi:ADP-ribosyl-[dinitrogen reductase] hydrolase